MMIESILWTNNIGLSQDYVSYSNTIIISRMLAKVDTDLVCPEVWIYLEPNKNISLTHLGIQIGKKVGIECGLAWWENEQPEEARCSLSILIIQY